MNIIVDTREKDRAIKKIIAEFDRQGIVYESSSLFVGDYMSLDNARRVVDRKQNLSELYVNMCHEGKKGRSYDSSQRFIKEIERAKKMGVGIYFLVEHGDGIRCVEDVKKWQNPQLEKNPYAWSGEYLCNRMKLLVKQYDNIRFKFCDKNETGKKIIELLGG